MNAFASYCIYCGDEPGKLKEKSRLQNVSSISSFTDSMVDWLDNLLLPKTDLKNNVRADVYYTVIMKKAASSLTH